MGAQARGDHYSISLSFLLILTLSIIIERLLIPTLHYYFIVSYKNTEMSFFSNEQRDYQKIRRNTFDQIGPGKYQPSQSNDKRNREAYAPFGSLSKKKTNEQNINVGPGQYNISSSIVKPSITKYQNKNIIIVKINDQGCHQFKSRSNRFQQFEASPVGPGSYDVEHSFSRKRKVMSTSFYKPKIAEKVRFINQKYIEQKQPTLHSDPPLIQANSQSTKNIKQKGKGVIHWGLNKQQRFDLIQKEEYNQDDKRKALSQISESKKKKAKPSAVFASKSIKSHLQTKIYKTNNSFKAELRKMINYKDQQPGPGSYEPLNKTPNNKVPQKFQFFGSTVERFPIQEEDSIGPGSYNVRLSSEGLRQNKDINTSFSQERNSYIPKKGFIPGPGAYKLDSYFTKKSHSQKQFDQNFGSNQQRFIYKTQSDVQTGVDKQLITNDYFREKQEKKEEELRILRKIVEDHPTSVFCSKSKRFIVKTEETGNIGRYDITQQDINSRLVKHQKLIKQLEECQLHKPPFLSSQSRFRSIKIHENDHKNCWCQVKSVEKQIIQHESPAFISNQKRIAVFHETFKAPPVGYYQKPNDGMIKDSFNSRFRKKNQNKIKKDLALKAKANNSNHLKTLPTHPSQPNQ